MYPKGLSPRILDLANVQSLQAFLERQRYEIPNFELRRWDEAQGLWIPFAWDMSRNGVCIMAGAVHRELNWKCQVWSMDGWCDPDTGAWLTREPSLCDIYPDRWQNAGQPFKPECSPTPPELALEWDEWRRSLPPYELRDWYERPAGHGGTPSQWDTTGWFHSLHEAREVAAALKQQRGLQLEIWYLDSSAREERYRVN